MLKTLGGKIMNNIGLKLLALFLAIVLWMAVVNIDDPSVRKSMTISVALKNQEYITDMGKYMDILGESNTVTFYYSTKRSVWDNLSNADFSAVADMQKIQAKDNGGYRVPVSVTATRNANQITIESKQLYLDVSLEDLGKKQFPIKANTSGTVAEGCALGSVVIDSANVVQVSGPASVVNAIDTVIATVNVEGMTTDVTDNVVPTFYDVDGQVIDTIKLEKSVETVRISAQILNTKEVALSLSTTGVMPEGYQLLGIKSNPTTVQIKGTAAILNTLDKIDIPAEVLDLTNITSSIEKTIDISTYLPNGVSLVISSDAKVNVIAEIEPIITREYQLPVSSITSEGLSSGYAVSYTQQYIPVNVTAGKSTLDTLNVADIKGVIGVGGLAEGTHVVTVAIQLDNSIYKISDVYAEIVLTKDAMLGDEGGTNGGADNNTKPEDENSTEVTTDGTGNEETEGTESTESKEDTDNTETPTTDGVR